MLAAKILNKTEEWSDREVKSSWSRYVSVELWMNFLILMVLITDHSLLHPAVCFDNVGQFNTWFVTGGLLLVHRQTADK